MALFTLQEILARLTRGFVKVTGRQPEGLDKIKIKQEALKKFMEQNKVVDMKGRVIDQSKGIMGGQEVGMFDNIFNRMQNEMKGLKSVDDRPPPGSRGGKDDIAAPVQSAEETLKDMIQAENKKNIAAMKKRKMLDDAIEDASPGFANDIKYDAEIVAENLAERMGLVYDDLPTKERLDLYDQAYSGLSKKRFKNKPEPEDKADGGRIGYKKGSVDLARRGFMKAAAGVGAGIGALKMGALKLFGKEGTRQVTKQIIKTDPVPGKPEWFDALVTKVINQGEDVTKKFATQERQTVHKLEIDSFKDSKGNKVSVEEVRVTQDADTGEIRVEYLTPDSPGESQVDLVYKKPKPDESDPNPSAEFYAVESEPRVVNFDGDIEFDGENLVDNVDDLMTDTTKLKMIAKGDAKPTLKEFVESKKKKDQVQNLNRDQMNQVDYIETKYGPGPDPSDYEDFARGGIARMLGE